MFTAGNQQLDTEISENVREQFVCPSGATLLVETGRSDTFLTSDEILGYSFDQCVVSTASPPLNVGTYELTGSLQTGGFDLTGSRHSDQTQSVQWHDFQLRGPEGLVYELTGSARSNVVLGAANFFRRERKVSIENYTKIEAGITESLEQIEFELNRMGFSGTVFEDSLLISGNYAGELSGGNRISIRMIQPFERTHTKAGEVTLKTQITHTNL